MSNTGKFAKKILMSQSFVEDGNEYEFLDITPDENGMSFNITVNVKLPKKGQSYIVGVFSGQIYQILNNVWKYVGESFSYSEHILIDGEEPVKSGVYISPEKELEVLNSVRRRVKRAEIKTDKNYLSFNISWRRADKFFYDMSDVYVDFYFYIELSDFEINGTKVTPSLNLADEIAGVISDSLYDSDDFRSRVDESLYSALNDEINLHNVDDLYLQGMWYVTKIDGWEAHPTMKNNKISDEMFT